MDCVASTECNRKGPDYFGLFTSEVAELISQDEDFLPILDQIFEKSGKERLKLLLPQSIVALLRKVDQILDLVFFMSVVVMPKVKESPVKRNQNKLDSNAGAIPRDGDVHSDLQFLLQNDRTKVESVMKKHYDELLAMLGCILQVNDLT
ncbi:hypothetical protein CQW23_28469 [Capsicum baccatum]|uniref:Uncharacterized protein n=1 Tax=Capsicum baccatum TaxID=33114 RepID=A0A2G2VGN0_CAPBA|nr:hypothetical protein CQW23_28469 [Capsicum baccatum]